MKKIEIGAILIILASIFFFRLSTVSLKEKFEIGDTVQITGRVDAGRGKIETINGKYPISDIYFTVDKIEDGNISFLGNITKITQLKWGLNYNVKSEKYVVRDNFFQRFFKNKMEETTENYSIDLINFMKAVFLGEGYLVDSEVKEMFKYTGTSHLLVISGLHIGVIISGLSYILLKFKIDKVKRYSVILIFLTIYVSGIGRSPSVFRAYIMGAIYISGNILYEKVNSKKSLFLSFVISLFIYPTWIYSLAFWMSYIAVFSIIFIYKLIPKTKKFKQNFLNEALNIIILSLTIQICMTPILYLYFNTIPLLSFISNVILIPIASAFVMVGFSTLFLSNFYLGFLTMPLVNLNYIILIETVRFLNNIPYLTLEL
ncbi:MAG: ComEC/Rec2 family competence protein [Cetobacterium sp.]